MHGPRSPVSVSVLYFAALRDLAGTHEERVALETTPLSVERFLKVLEEHRPELAGRMQSVRVAINEEFVETSAELSGDEVVALIPPVSGG